MKQLYEASYFKSDRKSNSAFFYACSDEQAEHFAEIIQDEMPYELKEVVLSEVKTKPTHDFKLLREKEKEILSIWVEL